MRNFTRTLINSITSLDFYHRLFIHRFSYSLKFYCAFLVLAALLRALPYYFSSIPTFSNGITNSLREVYQHYPTDLSLHWNGTQLESTQNPVYIYYSTALQQTIHMESVPKYLGYIDTTSTMTQPNTEAFFTVTATEILVPTGQGETAQMPLLNLFGSNPYTITKETVAMTQSFWENNKRSVVFSVELILPILLYLSLIVQRAIMLVLESTLFFFFRKIQGVSWSFPLSVQYALHIFIPAELIEIAAQQMYPQATISFFSLTVWLYFIAINFLPTRTKIIKVAT